MVLGREELDRKMKRLKVGKATRRTVLRTKYESMDAGR